VRGSDGKLDITSGRLDRGRGRSAGKHGRVVRVTEQSVPIDCPQVPHVQLGYG